MIAAAASATAQNGMLVGADRFRHEQCARRRPAPATRRLRRRPHWSSRRPNAWPTWSRSAMPNGRLRHVAYDAIIVATVTRGAHRSRRPGEPEPWATTPHRACEQIDAHLARLAEFDAAGDDEAYRDEVSDMVDFIEQRAPKLDAFLTEIRSIPAVNELVEGHRGDDANWRRCLTQATTGRRPSWQPVAMQIGDGRTRTDGRQHGAPASRRRPRVRGLRRDGSADRGARGRRRRGGRCSHARRPRRRARSPAHHLADGAGRPRRRHRGAAVGAARNPATY